MKSLRLHLAVFLLAAAPALADKPVELDVTHVAVFTSGVAYFERSAEVDGDATAELSFRTDQINDILKSLVVQDAKGRVGAVTYPTRDPIGRTLKSFAVDLTGKPTLGQLLDQLRGEAVEITGPASAKGIIIGVESKPVLDPDGKTLTQIERITLLTDGGLQHYDLTKLQTIKLTSPKIDEELRKALATLAGARDADRKSVRIAFEGQGKRPVRAAYMLEAPVWKASYRLVLSDDNKPFIQGWANVENTTESDWKNVRLSLVSGRPVSFKMDLYTPLYLDRPLETLEMFAGLRPPSYEGAFDVTDLLHARLEERAAAKSVAVGRRVPEAPAAPPAPQDAAGVALGNAMFFAGGAGGAEAVATGAATGELFAYKLDMPVSIPRQQAAMLPIVGTNVEAAKVSIFDATTHPKHPYNAVELKNTSGLNLMQGPITVFDGDNYAGDAKLPDLKPDEKRLVAYALDLGVEVAVEQKPQPEQVTSVWIRKGTLWHKRTYVDQREYKIQSKDTRPKTILVEQDASSEWKPVEPKEPYERTRDALRYKVAVEGGKAAALTVRLEKQGDVSVALSEQRLDEITWYMNAASVSPKVKQALEKVIRLRTEIDELTRARTELERKREVAVADQVRIRENLKTLDKSTDAYKRQLAQFDTADAQIVTMASEIDAARAKEAAKRGELESYLANLELD